MLITSAYAFTLSGHFVGPPEIASEVLTDPSQLISVTNISNTHLSEDPTADNDEVTGYSFYSPVDLSGAAGGSPPVIEVKLHTVLNDYIARVCDSTDGHTYACIFESNTDLTIQNLVSEEVSVHT